MTDWQSEPWDYQQRLAGSVRLAPLVELPRFVVGVDAAYVDRASGSDSHRQAVGIGAAVVVDTISFEVVEEVTVTMDVALDYQPGFLAFREAPVLLAAIEQLSARPELVVCDGHGVAHPQRCGLACHVGVALDVPTIGCAKQPMVGEHQPVGGERGNFEPIVVDGQTLGAAVRTSADVKLVYVSPGHLTDVETSVQHIVSLAPRYRLPETTRAADQLARRTAAECQK